MGQVPDVAVDDPKHRQIAIESFEMMDLNHDRLISHEEWSIQAAKAAAVIPDRNREEYLMNLEQGFRTMDRDHDGNITLEEFTTPTSEKK